MDLKLPILLDGATGTELQKRGYTGSEPAETWILSHPEEMLDLQRRYVEAGSDFIYAGTFGANPKKLGESGLGDRVEELNLQLVALTRQAADGKAYVGGDMSSLGAYLIPMGESHFEDIYHCYLAQAKALEKAGVDFYVIETMTSVAEARAALLAVKSVSRKPVLISFSAERNGRTMNGSDITAVLTILQSMGADAFGLNCSFGPEDMLPSLKRLSALAEIPLIAKPNAGLPEFENGKTVYRCTPEEFCASIPDFIKAGVSLFGGCCGSTPEHIAALRKVLDSASFVPLVRKEQTQLYAASEKELFPLPTDIRSVCVLPCDDNLGEALESAAEKEVELITVELRTEDELEIWEENQYGVARPLCLRCENELLLEKALRTYQGRALYEGPLPSSVLERLSQKYGLIY